MTTYEYKVVPAPRKGVKGKGVKGVDGRFAHGLEKVLSEHGAEGWEYLRSDTLPSDERSGLATSVTTWRTVLVFRRPRADDASAFEPRLIEAAAPAVAATAAAQADEPAQAEPEDASPEETLIRDSVASLEPEAQSETKDSDDKPA